jgi:MoaA/NifB/PqqE/SkfB family radical SAM enzyme
MKWDSTNISVFLDVSTYCNAGCPQCHRTDPNGLGKIDWLPLIQWDIETFKKAFPKEELENIREIDFCGTWGDPVMCKDLFEMIEHVIKNSDARIEMHTNGSIRDEEWWWDLGVLCGNRLNVYFTIDGINQEMHEKYRRFTDLQKTLDNMHSLSQTNTNIISQTIIFKHNQEYKEKIKALAKEYGAKNHAFIISDRFDTKDVVDNKRYFINENSEEEYLEKASDDAIINGWVAGRDVSVLEKEIICRWASPRNEILVNPDGQVFPCCYHGNSHFKGRMFGGQLPLHDNPVYKDHYNANLKKHNIFHTPLSEIMQSDWFLNTLPESIKGDNPVHQCEKQCSSRIKKDHQIRILDVT